MNCPRLLHILLTGILLLMADLARSDTGNPIGSEMEEIIVEPEDCGCIFDTNLNGNGNYRDSYWVGCRRGGYDRMEKTVIKFDIPSAPAGKKLISARLRVFFSGKSGSFGDQEQVVLLYSNDDNDGSVTKDDYQDNTYHFLSAYDPEEDDVNLNAIVSGGKDTGAWYEREVYDAVKNDGSGHSAFRLELYDHTFRTVANVFVFSTTYSPQLVLSYAGSPTVVGSMAEDVGDVNGDAVGADPAVRGDPLPATVHCGSIVEVRRKREALPWRDMDKVLARGHLSVPENGGEEGTVVSRAPGNGKVYVVVCVLVKPKRSIGRYDYVIKHSEGKSPCMAIAWAGGPFDRRNWQGVPRGSPTQVELLYEVPEDQQLGTLTFALPVSLPMRSVAIAFPN